MDEVAKQPGSASAAQRLLALVTGASSGIGQAFARRLCADGYDVIAVGRRRERLEALAAEYPEVEVEPIVADLSTDEGISRIAEVCEREHLALLVNNAGVAHYQAFTELSARHASEILHVKVLCTTLLAQAAARGMASRKTGAIINVAGMLAFSGPTPIEKVQLGRAVYTATLAHIVALSQTTHEELKGSGVRVQVLCPGLVATEFHERQGFDMSKYPCMAAEDVVTASLRGLDLGEVVCAPGVERTDLLDAAFQAGLTAFAAQSQDLAQRYRSER